MSRSDLENQVMMGARDSNIASVLFRNAMGRRLGLGLTDYEALSLLTIKGGASPTELSRYTGLTAGSTTAMLDRLEKAGFLKRTPNPDDRRGFLVKVDPRYQATAGPLVAEVQQAHRKLLGKYSEEELGVIKSFLKEFTENIETATHDINRVSR